MRAYYESVTTIYLVQQVPAWASRVLAAAAALGPHDIVSSDLVRMEAYVLPRKQKDASLTADFDDFFLHDVSEYAPFDWPVFDLAATLRADYTSKVKTPDALHLAAAIQSGCDVFLTNDSDLTVVPHIRVVLI